MMRRALHHLPAVAAVIGLGLLAYANSLQGAFVFDDVYSIADDPMIRDLGNYFSSAAGYRARPNRVVAYVTFALNYWAGGLDPTGYHAVNLAIHLINACLVYTLVVLAFRTPHVGGSALAAAPRSVAFVAAALFATHPLQTQAVSYTVQRLTSLASLFYLLASVLYLAWRASVAQAGESSSNRWRSRATYGFALASALLAMRTKEIAFTLPFALFLLEWAFFGRPGLRQVAAILPFAGIALLVPLSLVSLGKPVGELLSDVNQATRVQATVNRLDYGLTQLPVVARYLRLLAWPTGQNVDHDFPPATSLLEPRVAGALVLHLVLLGIAVWLWRRTVAGAARPLDPAARIIPFGILFFFLALLVESSLIPIADVIFEHRAYLPSAGFFPALAIAGALLLRRAAPTRYPRILASVGVAVALVLAVATLTRNRVWWTDIRLWTDAASKSPGKARPHFNLGTAYAEAGRDEEAIAALHRAVALDPAWARARTQLGGLLLLTNRLEEAEQQLREAFRLDPKEPITIYNLAEVLWRRGRKPEGSELYRSFLEVAPAASYATLRRIAAARSQARQ